MIGDWGALDVDGEWLEFRVSKDRAEDAFCSNPKAAKLVSSINLTAWTWKVEAEKSVKEAA